MKRITKMILLGAGILLTLAGCQKGTTTDDLSGKAVRFGVTSGKVSTRTAFAGDGTQDGTKEDEFGRKILTWERLSWAKNDEIMVASDNATLYQNPDVKYATYTVNEKSIEVSEDGTKSYATLLDKAASEELFFTDKETYTFWSIYPASKGDGDKLVNKQAEFEISASQAPGEGDATKISIEKTEGTTTVTKTLTTLPADMSQAVMLSAAENQTAKNVDLQFYPAFTAFEFTLNSQTSDLILKELVLTTAEGKSLAGSVAVSEIMTGGTTFDSVENYKITYPENDKKLTFTFPDNTTITKNDYVTFTVFAVPEAINGLTMEFHLGEDGSEIQTGTLKYNGNPIEFAARMKHNLRGIAVKGGWNFTYLTLDIKPLDWEPVESKISSGDGVQATQFAVNGASNLRDLKDAAVNASTTMTDAEKTAALNANKAYRQYWVFPAGQEVTVTYKIMMPLVGTWKVELCGDDAASFTVEPTSGNLAGATASATYITLKINSNATGEKTLYLKTTVTSGGETYNLDSETQLYDMRGYHYFVVNGNVDTE